MNTSRTKSIKSGRPLPTIQKKLALGLVLAGLLTYQPCVSCCAQESGSQSTNQKPVTATLDQGAADDDHYQHFLLLFNERKENHQKINQLYASMPIGVVQAQAEQRKKINAYLIRNLEIENEMVQTAVSALKTPRPPQPALVNLLMLRIERRLDGKNSRIYFDPPQALKLLEAFDESNPDLPDLTSYLYYANLLSNRFSKAREILENATAKGFTVPATTAPELEAYEKKWKQELEYRSVELADNDLPRVLFETDAGNIVVELFENQAPNTVNNFVALVEDGFYDGLTFHQVDSTLSCQSGCPQGDGTGGAGYQIPCEGQAPNSRRHFTGSLSMAHDGLDTGSSRFLIARQPLPHLDGKNTVFGQVTEGMPVVYSLRRAQPGNTRAHPRPPNRILKATVIRKRDHPYVPRKITDNKPEPDK